MIKKGKRVYEMSNRRIVVILNYSLSYLPLFISPIYPQKLIQFIQYFDSGINIRNYTHDKLYRSEYTQEHTHKVN